MTHCLICESPLDIKILLCSSCYTEYSGKFHFPRLARLSKSEQKLAEALIIHGGNLKDMSEELAISYPTLKKRLNELSDALQQKKKEDELLVEQIFLDIEAQKITAQEGIKRIKEINGEL